MDPADDSCMRDSRRHSPVGWSPDASKVPSDFIVDRFERLWEGVRLRFLRVKTPVITLDKGPGDHSRRSRFLWRIVGFARKSGLVVQLAYYPPYHSKSSPIGRCWGLPEMPRDGLLLDSTEALLGLARSMTRKGRHPVVGLVEATYGTGVSLKPGEMAALKAEEIRPPSLEERFVKISSERGRPRHARGQAGVGDLQDGRDGRPEPNVIGEVTCRGR